MFGFIDLQTFKKKKYYLITEESMSVDRHVSSVSQEQTLHTVAAR